MVGGLELTCPSYRGIFATLAIWLDLLVIFISMGVIAHSPPDYAISGGSSVGGAYLRHSIAL